MNYFGNRLKELRGEESLYEVAKAVGIQRTHLKRYEEGKYLPTFKTLEKLTHYYFDHHDEIWFLYFDDYFKEPYTVQMIVQWARQKLPQR